ncbi:MAG: UvrB/UvrC motif-containing protein, partial [Bdellovibrionales bacterium]
YADHETDSMKKAMNETARRRIIQHEYNQKNGVVPKTIQKKIQGDLSEAYAFHYIDEKIKGAKTTNLFDKYSKNLSTISKDIEKLKVKMKKLASSLQFEEAAKLRDEIKRLELFEMSARDDIE